MPWGRRRLTSTTPTPNTVTATARIRNIQYHSMIDERYRPHRTSPDGRPTAKIVGARRRSVDLDRFTDEMALDEIDPELAGPFERIAVGHERYGTSTPISRAERIVLRSRTESATSPPPCRIASTAASRVERRSPRPAAGPGGEPVVVDAEPDADGADLLSELQHVGQRIGNDPLHRRRAAIASGRHRPPRPRNESPGSSPGP